MRKQQPEKMSAVVLAILYLVICKDCPPWTKSLGHFNEAYEVKLLDHAFFTQKYTEFRIPFLSSGRWCPVGKKSCFMSKSKQINGRLKASHFQTLFM